MKTTHFETKKKLSPRGEQQVQYKKSASGEALFDKVPPAHHPRVNFHYSLQELVLAISITTICLYPGQSRRSHDIVYCVFNTI